jgi:hypothetical protein
MSFILIEDNMRFPVLWGFKSTLRKGMWSTHTTFQMKISVDNQQYDKLKSLFKLNRETTNRGGGWFKRKEGEVKFSLKSENHHTGLFDIISMLEISKFRDSRTIQLEVGNLSMQDASLQESRELALMELLG